MESLASKASDAGSIPIIGVLMLALKASCTGSIPVHLFCSFPFQLIAHCPASNEFFFFEKRNY
jgi:hypothetical protein